MFATPIHTGDLDEKFVILKKRNFMLNKVKYVYVQTDNLRIIKTMIQRPILHMLAQKPLLTGFSHLPTSLAMPRTFLLIVLSLLLTKV